MLGIIAVAMAIVSLLFILVVPCVLLWDACRK